MNDYVELFAVFSMANGQWICWTTEASPGAEISGCHTRRVRIPVPEELRIARVEDATVELVDE